MTLAASATGIGSALALLLQSAEGPDHASVLVQDLVRAGTCTETDADHALRQWVVRKGELEYAARRAMHEEMREILRSRQLTFRASTSPDGVPTLFSAMCAAAETGDGVALGLLARQLRLHVLYVPSVPSVDWANDGFMEALEDYARRVADVRECAENVCLPVGEDAAPAFVLVDKEAWRTFVRVARSVCAHGVTHVHETRLFNAAFPACTDLNAQDDDVRLYRNIVWLAGGIRADPDGLCLTPAETAHTDVLITATERRNLCATKNVCGHVATARIPGTRRIARLAHALAAFVVDAFVPDARNTPITNVLTTGIRCVCAEEKSEGEGSSADDATIIRNACTHLLNAMIAPCTQHAVPRGIRLTTLAACVVDIAINYGVVRDHDVTDTTARAALSADRLDVICALDTQLRAHPKREVGTASANALGARCRDLATPAQLAQLPRTSSPPLPEDVQRPAKRMRHT